jgi:alpha-L-arabinofuranosidase
MFKSHQGGRAIRALAASDSCAYTDRGGKAAAVNDVSVSASEKDGFTTLTITNLSLVKDREFQLETVGANWIEAAEVITLVHKDCRAHNTFANPDRVTPEVSAYKPGSAIPVPKTGIVSIRFKTGG